MGPKIWEILTVEIKQNESLLELKTKIKNWNPQCLAVCSIHLVDKQYENFEPFVKVLFGTSEQITRALTRAFVRICFSGLLLRIQLCVLSELLT